MADTEFQLPECFNHYVELPDGSHVDAVLPDEAKETSDRLRETGKKSLRTGWRFKAMPAADPIKIHLPDLRQNKDWSCGASCMEMVCNYFGVGPEAEPGFRQLLGTTAREGTHVAAMIDFAKRMGLHPDAREGWTLDELKEAIDAGRPVILLLQAWGYPKTYKDDGSGHYVIAIGHDAENIYFEDPWIKGHRAKLNNAEFERRWHDTGSDEKDTGHKFVRWGMACWKPLKVVALKALPPAERFQLDGLVREFRTMMERFRHMGIQVPTLSDRQIAESIRAALGFVQRAGDGRAKVLPVWENKSALDAAARFLADKWNGLVQRYGRAGAAAMLTAMLATFPIPGNIAAVIAAAEAARYFTSSPPQAAELGKGLIPGGLSEGMSDDAFDPEQLAAGIRVELEHTSDPDVAKEIAKDHLMEDPDYYTKLRRMEDKAMSALNSSAGGALVNPPKFMGKVKLKRTAWKAKFKSLDHRGKGSCKPGETAAQTGCTPASGEGGQKPQAAQETVKQPSEHANAEWQDLYASAPNENPAAVTEQDLQEMNADLEEDTDGAGKLIFNEETGLFEAWDVETIDDQYGEGAYSRQNPQTGRWETNNQDGFNEIDRQAEERVGGFSDTAVPEWQSSYADVLNLNEAVTEQDLHDANADLKDDSDGEGQIIWNPETEMFEAWTVEDVASEFGEGARAKRDAKTGEWETGVFPETTTDKLRKAGKAWRR